MRKSLVGIRRLMILKGCFYRRENTNQLFDSFYELISSLRVSISVDFDHLVHFRRNRMNFKHILAGLITTAFVAPAAFAKEKDIVDTAVAAGNFKTLVKAVQAAGLVDTLKSKGPFTVFAPTDEAFAKLPAGTLDSLLKDPAKLKGILTYHVVPAKVMAKDVKAGDVKTVNGQSFKVAIDAGKVKVDGANVVKTDIATSNGVIHVIDAVILPK
jgi:uncharacterized surface protein with fasciclin (FAS1) repeats